MSSKRAKSSQSLSVAVSQFRTIRWCKMLRKPANESVSKDSTIIHFICSRQSMPNQGMWTLFFSFFQRGEMRRPHRLSR
ncbi:uncharacterized protein CCOS01_03491 [Colletotrichum costaricense]|uniref:Uncharacterized protein n=1 Tax=Colletotrichum costaricense TaxID=1209916 RepID=A0AAI9Z5F7_9PEZI|nr:uncharacterized protein CCOS01_03491 [Colletotrichum costaricense]KAK1534739.1 hypothetical protein CCOS01_03491 [Colletotrichum costaricense]